VSSWSGWRADGAGAGEGDAAEAEVAFSSLAASSLTSLSKRPLFVSATCLSKEFSTAKTDLGASTADCSKKTISDLQGKDSSAHGEAGAEESDMNETRSKKDL
jgi:hypothetical protein